MSLTIFNHNTVLKHIYINQVISGERMSKGQTRIRPVYCL